MLWNLGSDTAEQFFKCWNTAVKLVYDVPRSTYTYLVEGFFSSSQPSLRNQVISRYAGFFRNLVNSPSKEVRFLVQVVKNDPRSTTCANMKYLRRKTGLNQPEAFGSARIRASLPAQEVPDKEKWRLGLITTLLMVRSENQLRQEDSKSICAMLDSLCNT